ncbi:MAG: protein kinase [Pirellulaceae bacterium]
MTQTQQHCSTPDHLLTFLRGQLNSREESELQLHLNDCVVCRERLDIAAADADAWNEAKQFFGNRALHESTDDSTGFHDEATQGAQRIRQVLDTLAPTDDPESLGRIGGYEVSGVVGSGGMGVVLKAHDRSLDRVVAVKVMSPHLASSGSARKRFAREAKAAAAVLHPNVIAIHSVASEDANPFLVMPYVRGTSLQKRIDLQGPLPLKDTLRIAAQIAAGLAAAHEQGLVHRDIKPANILLEEGVERVTITDFGLARAVDDASMTRSGVIAGTPQYMSPEQTRGEPIDARSDLFSLGSVLYAMCAGRLPFRAETTYGVLHRIANDDPTPVCEINSDVPEWLGRIIERLMAKRAEDRFESADQVAELLEGCLAHVQQPAAVQLPEAVIELAPNRTRRPPIGKFIAAAAGGVALFFAGILIVLELGKGTLTIESEISDVPIRIVQGKDVVEGATVSKSGESVRIAAGKYKVEIGGQIDGLALDNGSVTLQRGGNDVVRILKVAPVTNALGDWPYGRLMKDLQQIKPPGGVPVIPSGATIRVSMGNELTRRLEAAPDGVLDKWIGELERITGDKLKGEMARHACRTYIVNHLGVLFDNGKWNTPRADQLFFRARLISTSEAKAWKQAFESLLGEAIGQTDKANLNGGPSYAVPLVVISTDALFEIDEESVNSGFSDTQEKHSKDAAVKYRKRLSQLSKQDIATWRSKVDRFGGTRLDAAINIVLLDDYFVDEIFQGGDFAATLGGKSPVGSTDRVIDSAEDKRHAPQTRLECEAHPQDVIALQIGATKHNKPLEWTSTATEMGPFSVTITDEKVLRDDGSWGLGFTFKTQDAKGRTSTRYIAMAKGGPLPIGKFYLYKYEPNTLLDLHASVKVGEIKYPDGTSAPVSVTAIAANDTMVVLPVRVLTIDNGNNVLLSTASIEVSTDAISNNERLVFDPQYVNLDIEKYIKAKVHKSVDVVIPLDAAIHTNELMKANVGHSLLSLTAHDVMARTSVDGPFFKADSAFAHFCRLQSYEADVVNGKKVWLAKFTIPLAYSRTGTRKVQVIEADGKAVWKTEDGEQHYDQQVSQEEIDRLLKDSVQFRLDHYQGQPPRQVPIVKGRSAPKTYTDSGFNFGKLEQSGGMGAIGEQSKPEELSQTEQPPVELSPAEQALSELEAESNQLWSAYRQASEDAADEVELNRVYEEMDPRHIMPSKYLAIEEKYRGTDEGLKALVQVCSMARSVAGANSPAGKERRKAVKRVIEHYLQREGVESIIASLGGGPFVPQADELLQALVEKSPFRKTQAEALIAQIISGKKTLMVESQMPKVRAAVQDRMKEAPPTLRDEFEQRLKSLENTDFNQLRRDLNENLERLARLYSDVTVDHYGTGGTAALRLSHAINKVIIGQPAPELEAFDIDGKPFRLSELRGKHVVLMFAQSVNDDYGDMYAPIRQLVAKYRQAPVRVVGIMSNADQSLLHAAAKRGDLNWTVIPQPLNGPIQLDWGIEGYPAVYIVDAEGTLHPPLHMPYYGEGGYDTAEIDEAMEGLLREH